MLAGMTAAMLTTIACGPTPGGLDNGPDSGNGGVNTPVIVTLNPTTTITAVDPGDALATEASTSRNTGQQSPLGRFRVATEPAQYVEYFFIEFGPSRVGLGIEFSDEWWSESAGEHEPPLNPYDSKVSEWARRDSNPGPPPCHGGALTN